MKSLRRWVETFLLKCTRQGRIFTHVGARQTSNPLRRFPEIRWRCALRGVARRMYLVFGQSVRTPFAGHAVSLESCTIGRGTLFHRRAGCAIGGRRFWPDRRQNCSRGTTAMFCFMCMSWPLHGRKKKARSSTPSIATTAFVWDPGSVVIPDKLYFRIGEALASLPVAELCPALLGDGVSAFEARQGQHRTTNVPPPRRGICATDQEVVVRRGLAIAGAREKLKADARSGKMQSGTSVSHNSPHRRA